jgi:hypothetical protein
VLAIRPDDWNFPLLLHVAGAMLLVGTLLVAVWALLVAPRRADGPDGGVALMRLGWWTLLAGVLPSWLLMRIAGQWIASEEGFEGENDPGWVDVGYITAEPGALVLLIALILGGLAVRRARRSDGGGGGGLATAAGVLSGILLVAYLVAMWAMTTKPD